MSKRPKSNADLAAFNLSDKVTKIYKEQGPTRNKVYQRTADFMNNNLGYTTHPWYQTGKAGVEEQYGIAKDQILANIAAGGGLDSALKDVELSRAKSLTDLMGQIAMDEYNKAYGVAMNAPQVIQGYGTAGQILASGDQARASGQAAQSQLMGQIGSSIGMIAGTMLTGGNPIGGKAGSTIGQEAGHMLS